MSLATRSRLKNGGLKRLSFGLVWGETEFSPLLPNIDSARGRARMKSIAVEAFGRHLKGADASLPFLLSVFSEIPEKPRRRIDSIPFLYSLGVSVGIKPLVHFGYCSGQIFSKHIRSGMQREKFAGL